MDVMDRQENEIMVLTSNESEVAMDFPSSKQHYD